MKKSILFLLLLSMSACATKNIGTGGSYVYGVPNQEISTIIAKDIADYISQDIAIGETSIALLTPIDDTENAFSTVLEMEFRSRGYRFSQKEKAQIVLKYTLKIVEDTYFIQFHFDEMNMARSYRQDGAITNWTNWVQDGE